MDLATLIGLIVGAGLLFVSISDNLEQFIDIPSVFIVIGGALAATLISLPLGRVLSMAKIAKNAFFATKNTSKTLIGDLVRFGEVARRDGILALEGVMDQVSDPFLARGIQLAVDGNDPDSISDTLAEEMDYLGARHEDGKKIFEAIGKYAPAFGMIGTLIGLVAMLENMDDPSKIGAGMAAALLTTLYGALLANVVFLPLADKLALRSAEEALAKTVVIRGVMSIQSGDNPRTVESKLMTFLPPGKRLFQGCQRHGCGVA